MARNAVSAMGMLVAGVLVWTCCVNQPRSPYADHSVIPPILRVDGKSAKGSGVPIHQNGDYLWILTSRHINLPQTAGGMKVLEVERHPDVDLALLKVLGTSPLVPLADRDPAPGERLRAIGWNLTDFLAMTDGRARPRDQWMPKTQAGMTCPILFGASGGAVMNEDGQLVGIVKGLIVFSFEHAPGARQSYHPAPWLSLYIPVVQAKEWIRRVTEGKP